jgi:hypothetical protein
VFFALLFKKNRRFFCVKSNMKKEYKVTPKIWGPMAWNFLHNLPEYISTELDNNLKEKYINFLYNYENFLPCKICIKHYREFIYFNKINIKKLNKKYLEEYICKLHNNVNKINKINKKKQYTFLECSKSHKKFNNKNFYTYINIVLLYHKKNKNSITKINTLKNMFKYLEFVYPNLPRRKIIKKYIKENDLDNISDTSELINWYLKLLKKLKFKN